MLRIAFLLAVYLQAVDGFRSVRLLSPQYTALTSTSSNRIAALHDAKTHTVSAAITSPSQYETPQSLSNKPVSAASLAFANFRKDTRDILAEIKRSTLDTTAAASAAAAELPTSLGLTLSNAAVAETERQRELAGGRVEAHPIARALYEIGCKLLDVFFAEKRPLERFWFLETIARIPYFVYISVLHLYESLGWWRETSLRRVHAAEEWNELHHLLIMESLGANKRWVDRFLAYNAAVAYYWMLVVVYMISPRVAYQFMELLEAHAADTYATFVIENEEKLKRLPPPVVASKYYTGKDMYFFDEFQVDTVPGARRPPCANLFDVFSNIRDDEMEHVRTMRACQSYAVFGAPVLSPHERFLDENDLRKEWSDWANRMNIEE